MNTTSEQRIIPILEGNNTDLLDNILYYLTHFDNYIQDAGDKGVDTGEFEESYHALESHYFRIRSGEEPDRIAIIGIVKHTYKLAYSEIYLA